MMTASGLRKLVLAGLVACFGGVGLSAAPLQWFPGPAVDTPMSGAATVVSGGNNFLTGGDAYANYFFPVSYPISLAATNAYWTYWSPYYSLNIAPGAVVNDGNIVLYGGSDGDGSVTRLRWAVDISAARTRCGDRWRTGRMLRPGFVRAATGPLLRSLLIPVRGGEPSIKCSRAAGDWP